MKKALTALLITWLAICGPLTRFASAEEDPTIDEQICEDAADEEGYESKECPQGTRACKVDQAITEIEDQIKSVSKKCKTDDIWEPPSKIPPDASGGRKLASYTLMAPTYVVRLVTWPIAVVGDALVKKGVIRKVVDIVSNDERTRWVYPKLELGFGSGFGGGVGFRQYDLFRGNYELGAAYQIHVNMNQEAYAYFGTPDAFYLQDKPIGFKIRTDFIHHHDTDYFGTGIQTAEGDRAKYGIDTVQTKYWMGYEIIDHFSIIGRTSFEWDSCRGGKGGPSVDTQFPPSEIKAFGDDLYYLSVGLSLIHDNRDSDIIPERGGIREISFDRYQGLNTTDYDYNEYNLKVAQFIPALMPRHVVVLRTAWKYQQQASIGIPFYRLAKFDVNSPARGFDYSRFSDRGSAVFNVEYRFPVWKFLDGQIFFDTGRVFHSPGDFSFKHFKYDGGVGLRFRTPNYFLMRVQVAYGGEGPKFLLRTSQAF